MGVSHNFHYFIYFKITQPWPGGPVVCCPTLRKVVGLTPCQGTYGRQPVKAFLSHQRFPLSSSLKSINIFSCEDIKKSPKHTLQVLYSHEVLRDTRNLISLKTFVLKSPPCENTAMIGLAVCSWGPGSWGALGPASEVCKAVGIWGAFRWQRGRRGLQTAAAPRFCPEAD